eukprot:GHVL01013842.1.p1 GENE.GHVL01013842.1~~GHVL01013842.1.p1  ORF type:complete len:585 (+),score=99.52 GHVL01013842.1:40-1794(+)
MEDDIDSSIEDYSDMSSNSFNVEEDKYDVEKNKYNIKNDDKYNIEKNKYNIKNDDKYNVEKYEEESYYIAPAGGRKSKEPLQGKKNINKENSLDDNIIFSKSIRRVPLPKPLVLVSATLICFISTFLGYDIGVMAGAILFIREDFALSNFQTAMVMGLPQLLSCLGIVVAGRFADLYGRRLVVGASSVIALLGTVTMALAPSYVELLLGRVFLGASIGGGLMVAPMYLVELSPYKYRGRLTALTEVWVNVGILLGYISGYIFSDYPLTLGWRWMLGLASFPPAAVLIAVSFLPESPRWLFSQGRVDEATDVLHRTCEVDEVQQSITDMEITARESTRTFSEWSEFLKPSRELVYILIAGVGIGFFQQANGVEAAVYYSNLILMDAGVTNKLFLLMGTIVMGTFKLITCIMAAAMIDLIGRKFLLYSSFFGMSLSLYSFAMSTAFNGIPLIKIIFFSLYIAAFSFGVGPIFYILPSEVFPMRLRSKGVAIGFFVNRLLGSMINFSYLFMAQILSTGGVFCIFGSFSLLGLIWAYNFVPETNKKVLEEIQDYFKEKSKWTSINDKKWVSINNKSQGASIAAKILGR